jgi:hypothetical protein
MIGLAIALYLLGQQPAPPMDWKLSDSTNITFAMPEPDKCLENCDIIIGAEGYKVQCWSGLLPKFDGKEFTCVKPPPEPLDVPPVHATIQTLGDQDGPMLTCKDRSRILLREESGRGHCLSLKALAK